MAPSRGAGISLALLLAALVSLPGCALRTQPGPVIQDEPELEGVWDGLSINACSPLQEHATRCRAVHRISFTMLRENANVSGFYRCAPGTTPCYNRVESSVVESGVVKSLHFHGRTLWFRVMRDDHSSCLFNTIPSANRMRGGFYCSGVERGAWQVDRVY